MYSDIMATFQTNATIFATLTACFLYSYAPMQTIVGGLIDKYGLRSCLFFAALFCGIGSLVFGASSSLSGLIIGRILMGSTAAFGFVAMVYATTHYFPHSWHTTLLGIGNSLAMLGAMAGGGPLQHIVELYGYSLVMVYAGFFGLALSIVLLITIPKAPETSPIDAPNLLHALKGKVWGILTSKPCMLNAISAAGLYVTTAVFSSWGPAYLNVAHGLSESSAAFTNSLMFFGWLVGGPIMGLLATHQKIRFSIIRYAIVLVFLLLSVLLFTPSLSELVISCIIFLIGFTSSAELCQFVFAFDAVPLHMRASAIAITNFIISFFDGAMQQCIGLLLDAQWSGHMFDGVRQYTQFEYTLAFSPLLIALVVSYVTFLLFERHLATKE